MRKTIALAILLAAGICPYAAVQGEQPASEKKQAAESAAEAKRSIEDRAAPAAGDAKQDTVADDAAADPERFDWTKVDWKKRLTRLQYYITREAGTERAFTGKYWDFFKPGQYRCVGCGLPLFESDAKFESDCGWPSFDRPISEKALTEHVDFKIGYPRTEIRCRRCQAHLGHVFNDGPTDTGQRYCLNSAAMKFVSEKALKAEKEQSAEQQPPTDKPAPVATDAESKAGE
ncbi:MAG: peptide-methionine (R)-S-oxide reductase MsrB [Pirellulales bacterium]|nr:peptide-methionine (R)-S-oxide reductase MsrB [Pirellulales bacterium]